MVRVSDRLTKDTTKAWLSPTKFGITVRNITTVLKGEDRATHFYFVEFIKSMIRSSSFGSEKPLHPNSLNTGVLLR